MKRIVFNSNAQWELLEKIHIIKAPKLLPGSMTRPESSVALLSNKQIKRRMGEEYHPAVEGVSSLGSAGVDVEHPSHKEHPTAQQANVAHEAYHNVVDKIADVHGWKSRQAFINKMYSTMHPVARSMITHAMTALPDYVTAPHNVNEHLQGKGHPDHMHHLMNEAVAYLVSSVNSPVARENVYKMNHPEGLSLDKKWDLDKHFKDSVRNVMQAAKNITDKDLHEHKYVDLNGEPYARKIVPYQYPPGADIDAEKLYGAEKQTPKK